MTADTAGIRRRGDMCPGASRPWLADDGLLVRLRLVGGQLPISSLTRLLDLSRRYTNGSVHLTQRANIQIRGLPSRGTKLEPEVLQAISMTGLLPSASHELVRNILVSPCTGVAGGRTDLRPVSATLDAALRANDRLAQLPGRFLFTLDDGRGDLMDRLTQTGRRGSDLGVVALTDVDGQLRIGDHWGEVVTLNEAALHLAALASTFLSIRGSGPSAPWHVRELPTPLCTPTDPDPRLPPPSPRLPYGHVPGGWHEHIPGGVLHAPHAAALLAKHADGIDTVVVTPWHGIYIPDSSHLEASR